MKLSQSQYAFLAVLERAEMQSRELHIYGVQERTVVALTKRGLVSSSRISGCPKRYQITETGLLALNNHK